MPPPVPLRATLYPVPFARLEPKLRPRDLLELRPVLAVRQGVVPDHQPDALFQQFQEVLLLLLGHAAGKVVHDDHVRLELTDVVEGRVRATLPDPAVDVVVAAPELVKAGLVEAVAPDQDEDVGLRVGWRGFLRISSDGYAGQCQGADDPGQGLRKPDVVAHALFLPR